MLGFQKTYLLKVGEKPIELLIGKWPMEPMDLDLFHGKSGENVMKNLSPFLVTLGTVMVFAGCGDKIPKRRVDITPPKAELTFDEAFVKDRDIYFNTPEDVILGTLNHVEVDSKGNLIVLDFTQGTIFLADAEGNYLRQIGARGGAEGEYFSVIELLLAPNGDLYTWSMGEGLKYMVFSGGSYEFKREVPDPNSQYIDHLIVTEGGHMYASQVDLRMDGIHALFRFDDNFKVSGKMYPVADQRTATALHRFHNTLLTPKTGGGFYFMYPTTYEIHRYSEQGDLEQTLFSSYQSKYRDGIKPFPADLDPYGWNPKTEAWFAEHIVRGRLFECDSDLLVLVQYRREIGNKYQYYLNLLYKDGYSVADGIRVPANHIPMAVAGSELYCMVRSAFDEATGAVDNPYLAVYRLKPIK